MVEIIVPEVTGVPRTLVQYAVEEKKRAQSEARRERDINLKYEHVWCVFDIDAHPRIPEARDQANAHGISLAISNPCFELWILLHFQDQTAQIERRKAASAVRRHLPKYRKSFPYAEVQGRYIEAIRRARDLDSRARKNGMPGCNPTTGVYVLTELVRSLSKARQIERISQR